MTHDQGEGFGTPPFLLGMKLYLQGILLFVLALTAAGCTTPLTIAYDPKLGASTISVKEPLDLVIVPYKDERPERNPRKLGDIRSTVIGMDSTELIIGQDVAALVTDAVKEQLALAGFKVHVAAGSDQSRNADLMLQGVVKAFRLDIGPKDEIAIELDSRVTDVKSGNILWSGEADERASRFAGTMGDTRATISRYVSSHLAKAVKETATNIVSAVEKARALEPSHQELLLPGDEGRLALSTTPSKAQIYIADVYYGLSPTTIDLAPGIYPVIFKLGGFKDAAQKIAVRKGSVTEFSIILEKE